MKHEREHSLKTHFPENIQWTNIDEYTLTKTKSNKDFILNICFFKCYTSFIKLHFELVLIKYCFIIIIIYCW